MRNQIKLFLKSCLSRKFVITFAGVIALWSIHQYSEMVVLILGYVGVEGGADIVSRYKNRTLTASDVQNVVSQNIDDAPDTSKVVTGKDVGTPLFDELPKKE